MGNRKNSDRIYRVPLVLGEAILPSKINPEDITTWYVNGKKRKVCLVTVSKEVYDIIINPDEAEKKQKQRMMQKAEKDGEQYAPALSLDALQEDSDFDVSESEDFAEIVLIRFLMHDALELIKERKPQYADFLDFFSHNYTEREIADKLGISRNTVKSLKKRALKLLETYLQ